MPIGKLCDLQDDLPEKGKKVEALEVLSQPRYASITESMGEFQSV